MTNETNLGVLAFLYLVGCALGVIGRYAMWTSKQPEDGGTVLKWWHARKGSNLIAILVGVLGTGVWITGRMTKWIGLDGTVPVDFAVSPIAGFVLVFFGHWILSTLGKRLGDRAGTPPAEQED